MEDDVYRFGTLGAANITPRALIYPCMDEPRARVYAIAARDRERAVGFANHHHIPKVFDRYDEVIQAEKVDLVYNPLHITAHREWTLKAIAAGKHVLCEKSFAANASEAEEMAQAADASGLVVMDAFHYRYHPLFLRAKEIYDSGELGEIESLDAAFHIPVLDKTGIRMNYALGGGVTMDIGCYPISWVRHITGQEPLTLKAEAEVGPPNVDTMLRTTMEFGGGVRATTSGDMRESAKFEAFLGVKGTRGEMYLRNPLVPQTGHVLTIKSTDGERTETFDRRPSYAYQLDAFLDAVEKGAGLYTDAWDGVAQMHVIDRAYEAAGLPIRGLDPDTL